MLKTYALFILLLPLSCFAQFTISGRILNQADTKPVANASVFLSNSSVGDKTTNGGTFILQNIKPGKYELIVSIVGFEAFHQTVMIINSNINLHDITIFPKTIALNEVSIKPVYDPNRDKYFYLFKDEFLGTSALAKECKILNPELLDLNYDETTSTLTASSVDFLVIENDALGYKIKYLLTNFILDDKDDNAKQVHYQGYALFEEMKGSPSQQKHWQKRRQQAYEGSEMHFLRSAISNRLDEEGFRVLQLAIYSNPQRPADSLIEAKLKLYKKSKSGNNRYRDSLSAWLKLSRLPKMVQALMHFPLKSEEIISSTGQKGIFALSCNNDALYITYDADHHFPKNGQLTHLDDPYNTGITILNFKAPYAFFDNNGGIIDPNSLAFRGAWGRNRTAELLPVDYELPKNENTNRNNIATENAVSKLKDFSMQHIVEKAYLHFDKPYYAAGDTIYFKAYVTMGELHQPSNISSVLSADLINTNNKIDKSIKLQITNGVAWGDFALPDSLPKGNYRVRAYTNWMRNDGDGAYFNQTFPIGSILNNKVPESGTRNTTAANTKADMQFFPEGGRMVTGIKSKVAFKAISADGMGLGVKGVITDNENKEITTFASAHLGMGYFYLTPQEGKTYRAKLTYADGTQNTIELPAAENKGIVLSINNDSLPKASVRIEASKTFYQENKSKDFTLLIYSGGIATSVTCNLDSSVITLDILKRRLHTGIATVTLFSPAGEPLDERLLFVQNYDQLSLALRSDKPAYTKSEKVNISLNVKDRAGDPAAGHFSVSVTDENKVPVDGNAENTILTNLLLTSDLKGYVELPNYYFNNVTDKTSSDLELVMLTHGYRRFEWKQLLNNAYPPIAFQPDSNLEITGTAESLGGKPLANANVSLIAMPGGQFTSQVTDDKGRFRFSNLVFSDTARFMLQADNAKGKNTTKLIYNKDMPGPVVVPIVSFQKDTTAELMSAYMENSKKEQDEAAQYGTIKGKMLKTVIINEKKQEDHSPYNNLVSEQFADQVIHADQMAKGGSFSERIEGLLHGAHIGRVAGGVGAYAFLYSSTTLSGFELPMRVILDGAETDGDLDELTGLDVESVEVLKSPGTTGAYNSLYIPPFPVYKGGYDGILVINTNKNKGLQLKDIASIGVLPIAPKGFYIAREFYSPKYDHPLQANNRPDLRSTIFWKPELVTDKDGNAAFEFYNADGTGSYRIVVEGIDDKGNIGRQVYRYKVE